MKITRQQLRKIILEELSMPELDSVTITDPEAFKDPATTMESIQKITAAASVIHDNTSVNREKINSIIKRLELIEQRLGIV